MSLRQPQPAVILRVAQASAKPPLLTSSSLKSEPGSQRRCNSAGTASRSVTPWVGRRSSELLKLACGKGDTRSRAFKAPDEPGSRRCHLTLGDRLCVYTLPTLSTFPQASGQGFKS